MNTSGSNTNSGTNDTGVNSAGGTPNPGGGGGSLANSISNNSSTSSVNSSNNSSGATICTSGSTSGSTATAVVAASAATTSTGAKITHVKTTTIDHIGLGSNISPANTIKLTTATGAVATPIGGTPIALNASQPTSIRTIGSTGQPTQVRVVMPTSGRTQITAIQAGGTTATVTGARTLSNTTITVTKPPTQTAYLSRAGITTTQITNVGISTAAFGTAPRLVTPIRATPAVGTMPGVTVAGLTASSFSRATTVSRNVASSATPGISSTMTTKPGSLQLLHSIPQQSRRIITTTQGAAGAVGSSNNGIGSLNVPVSVTGSTIVTNATSGANTIVNAGGGNSNVGKSVIAGNGVTAATIVAQTGQSQHAQPSTATIQTIPAQPIHNTGGAALTLSTVLPPRQHQATLVYSSNIATTGGGGATVNSSTVGNTANITSVAQSQFSPTIAGQRFAMATPLTATTSLTSASTVGISGTTTRPIRPMTITKPLLNTSINLRPPQLPAALGGAGATHLGAGNIGSNTVTISNNSITGSSISNINSNSGAASMTTSRSNTAVSGTVTNLTGTTRIIPAQRLPTNLMLHPIIVNTSGGSKLGIRPQVSMSAKGQTSLTITPFGKFPSASSVSGQSQSSVVASIQTINNMGLGPGVSGGNTSPKTSSSIVSKTPTTSGIVVSVGNTIPTTGSTLVAGANGASSIGPGGGNINVGVGACGSTATVVPLTITRGNTAGNILTGITPIKNVNSIAINKAITATPSVVSLTSGASGVISETGTNCSTGPASNIFVQQAQQRSGGGNENVVCSPNVSGATTVVLTSSAVATVTTVASGNTGVGNTTTTAFMPSNAIYYEPLSTSSGQVSAGVLSITATTTTTPINSSTAGPAIAISSMPFATSSHTTTTSGAATFAVMSNSGGRAIGQLQVPISSVGNTNGGSEVSLSSSTGISQIPMRFSAPNVNTSLAGSIGSSNPSCAPVTTVDSVSLASTAISAAQPIVIPASVVNATVTVQHPGPQTQHVVIPLTTSVKVTTGNLRKRDLVPQLSSSTDAGPIRAAKNLAPTLLAMNASSSASSSTPSSFITTNFSLQNNALTSTAISTSGSGISSIVASPSSTVGLSNASGTTVFTNVTGGSNNSGVLTAPQTAVLSVETLAMATSLHGERPISPASSDGSTTVSANSSPGIEQQIEHDAVNSRGVNVGMLLHAHQQQQHNVRYQGHHGTQEQHLNDATHFNPIQDLYASHHQQQSGNSAYSQQNSANLLSTARDNRIIHPVPSENISINGSIIDCPPRKKSRRNTNDSQLSNHSQPSTSSLGLPPPTRPGSTIADIASGEYNSLSNLNSNNVLSIGNSIDNIIFDTNLQTEINVNAINNMHKSSPIAGVSGGNGTTLISGQPTGGKENTKPVEYILRRPRNCTLMTSYKLTSKPVNNHFIRHTDVKQRDERRPTVIDLANQANVHSKLAGWKVHYLRSQMEDLVESESSSYDQLAEMLKEVEGLGKNSDFERINDLLKGNMQRSKIIVDGVNEAQSQMMKIFDHQSHIADILSRCASKRNFKKRDKV